MRKPRINAALTVPVLASFTQTAESVLVTP